MMTASVSNPVDNGLKSFASVCRPWHMPAKGRNPLNNTLIFLGLLGIIGAIRWRCHVIVGASIPPIRYKMKNFRGFAEGGGANQMYQGYS